MSTATTGTPGTGGVTPQAPTIDVSDTPAVPFGRLVSVELRKMRDTRAGFWLLVATATLLVIAAVVTLLVTLLNDNVTIDAGSMVQVMTVPLSLLMPVLAITCVTSEWSQRTGLVTFTLEPHRMRVVAAKFVTVIVLALVTMVVAVALGAVTNALYGALSGDGADWTLEPRTVGWTVVTQVLFFIMAFAFGLLFLNTPAAIAVYYVVALLLPFMVYGPIYGILSWGPDVVPWIDLGFAAGNFSNPAVDITGKAWAQLGVTTGVWVVLPTLLGLRRIARAELK